MSTPVPGPPVPRAPVPAPAVPALAVPAPPVPGPLARPDSADQRVEQTVARLDELEALPVDEHAAVYDAVHRELAGLLSDAGGPAGPPGSPAGR